MTEQSGAEVLVGPELRSDGSRRQASRGSLTAHREAPTPAPRRTRSGRGIVGASIGARYRPLALAGLPLLAIPLGMLAAAALRNWGYTHYWDQPIAVPLTNPWIALPVAYLLTWALLAVWALVPIALTTTVAEVDESRRLIRRRAGLRTTPDRPLESVVWVVGDAERDGYASIGLAPADDVPGAMAAGEIDPADPSPADPGGPPPAGTPEQAVPEEWHLPHVGWDARSFEGLRALQRAAHLPVAPPFAELRREHVRLRVAQADHAAASRLGMPWRDEYLHDHALFERDFDAARLARRGRR